MDGYQFDELGREQGARATRRGALGIVAGFAGLGIAGLARLGDAGARKKKKKGKRKPVGCRVWVLAGEADPNGPDAHIRVDDDLTVSVNGQVVARNNDGQFSEVGPYIFSAKAGDQLRIVATDVGPGWHELDPLFLRCASGGSARKLSDGFTRTESFPDPAGTFFDETFTI